MSSEGNRPEHENWIAVARLIRVRGNRGEVAAIDLTSKPGRLESLSRVWLFGDGSPREVESVWRHDGKPVFKFRGIDTISDAETLVGAEIRIPWRSASRSTKGSTTNPSW